MRGPVLGSLDLSAADAKVTGDTYDQLGTAVAAAGDMDGDGRADLAIGAPSANTSTTNTGSVYLGFGW